MKSLNQNGKGLWKVGVIFLNLQEKSGVEIQYIKCFASLVCIYTVYTCLIPCINILYIFIVYTYIYNHIYSYIDIIHVRMESMHACLQSKVA